jgi:hypothetical protein
MGRAGVCGAAGAWLRSAFTTGVAGHELGHNWGLNHANYWDTTGQSVIGPGTSIEYGDTFDTMGSANAGNNHFKRALQKLPQLADRHGNADVTSNGTYRITPTTTRPRPGCAGYGWSKTAAPIIGSNSARNLPGSNG